VVGLSVGGIGGVVGRVVVMGSCRRRGIRRGGEEGGERSEDKLNVFLSLFRQERTSLLEAEDGGSDSECMLTDLFAREDVKELVGR